MEITYELSRFDVFSTFFTIFIRNPLILCLVLGALALSLFTEFGSQIEAGHSLPVLLASLAMRILIFALILFGCQALVAGSMVFLQNDRGLVGRHVLQITDAGLVESTEVNQGLHKWAGIHKIKSGPSYLYIYTGPSRFFHVPKAALPPGQLEAFEQELRRRINANK